MSAPRVIYHLLNDHAPLTSVVNNRIYFGVIPQSASLPAITYSLISENEDTAVGLTTLKLRSRVQVTIASKSYAEVITVRQLVKIACNNKQGLFNGVQVDSVIADGVGADFRDDDLRIYYTTIDFRLHHDEWTEESNSLLLAGLDTFLVTGSNVRLRTS